MEQIHSLTAHESGKLKEGRTDGLAVAKAGRRGRWFCGQTDGPVVVGTDEWEYSVDDRTEIVATHRLQP